MLRTWTTLLCASLAVGFTSPSAGADNSANAKLCQHGAWQSWQRTDGTTFKNEGACVSYAAQGGTLATFTTSTTSQVTYVHVDLPTIDVYSTRIQAFVDLDTVCDGNVFDETVAVYDQTLQVPATSDEVNAAFQVAQDAVTALAEAYKCDRSHLVLSGPSLLSSSDTAQTVFVDSQFDHNVVTTTTTMTAGPATVFVGPNQSQALFVPAGTVNINTNTDTDSFVDQRYQTTISHSRGYVVIGSLITRP